MSTGELVDVPGDVGPREAHLAALIVPFRSRTALEAEVLVLRHQLNVLRRGSPKRLAFSNVDRLVFVGLYRLVPAVLEALKIESRRR